MNGLKTPKPKLTPLKAIRAKCLDCSAGQYNEIKYCTVDCALKPYRFGHRPKEEAVTGNESEEELR